MWYGAYNIYENKIYDNNSIKARKKEMVVYYSYIVYTIHEVV